MELTYYDATLVARNTSLDSLSALLVTYPPWLSLTLSIWHHLLYLDEEVDFIWNMNYKNCITKGLYIVVRYGTDITLIYYAYITCGFVSNLTLQHCIVWPWMAEILVMLIISFWHASVFVTIRALWAGRTKMKCFLVIAWFASLTPTTLLCMLVAVQFQSTFSVIPLQQPHTAGGICIISQTVHMLPWQLVCLSIGDLIQLVAMVVNALDAPRLSDKQIISSIDHDGAFYYFLNFMIRVVDVVILRLGGLKYYGILLPLQVAIATILPAHHYLLFSKAKESTEVVDRFDCMEEEQSLNSIVHQ